MLGFLNRELINIIRSQQMKFFEHIMRNEETENTIVTRKIEKSETEENRD